MLDDHVRMGIFVAHKIVFMLSSKIDKICAIKSIIEIHKYLSHNYFSSAQFSRDAIASKINLKCLNMSQLINEQINPRDAVASRN